MVADMTVLFSNLTEKLKYIVQSFAFFPTLFFFVAHVCVVLSDDMLDFFQAIPLQNYTDGGEKKTINLMMLLGKEESNSAPFSYVGDNESNFEYLKCGGAGKQNNLENKVP